MSGDATESYTWHCVDFFYSFQETLPVLTILENDFVLFY